MTRAFSFAARAGQARGFSRAPIHANSKRASAPFVTLNCPSLSAELLESELFGHVRGAFTGAIRDTSGKVAMAEGGTVFLDEIGDIPALLQPKLLRLLQEKCYEHGWRPQTRKADVRILAATNRDLESAVTSGHFREDLLYRLNVIEVTLPPLRQRPGDIVPLAEHLLRFLARPGGEDDQAFYRRDERRQFNGIPGRVICVSCGMSSSARRHSGADDQLGIGRPPPCS